MVGQASPLACSANATWQDGSSIEEWCQLRTRIQGTGHWVPSTVGRIPKDTGSDSIQLQSSSVKGKTLDVEVTAWNKRGHSVAVTVQTTVP